MSSTIRRTVASSIDFLGADGSGDGTGASVETVAAAADDSLWIKREL